MLHGFNTLVDTAEERTRTGRPAETVGRNSRETRRQSQETPERRDLSRGRGCGLCRRPHLLGGSRPRCRSPAVHTGRAPPLAAVHTVVPLLPESQRPSREAGSARPGAEDTTPRGRTERRVEGIRGGERNHRGDGLQPVAGVSLLTSGLDGSLLWGQPCADPFPGVTASCPLVDGRQQQERVSDVRRNAGPGDPTFREKLFGTCSPGLGGATGRGGVLGLGGWMHTVPDQPYNLSSCPVPAAASPSPGVGGNCQLPSFLLRFQLRPTRGNQMCPPSRHSPQQAPEPLALCCRCPTTGR